MGIGDWIDGIIEKNRKKKEMMEQMKIEDTAIHKMEQSKKTPMERELEKYKEQERQKSIETQVLKIRKDRKISLELTNAPIRTKNIFKEKKQDIIINAPYVFKEKPRMKQKNIFNTPNIFTSKVVKR